MRGGAEKRAKWAFWQRVTCPVSRLYGQVTADVRGGAARRWGTFRVAEHSGVGSRAGKNWGVRGNLSGIAGDRAVYLVPLGLRGAAAEDHHPGWPGSPR